MRIGEQHGEAVDADAFAGGGRHAEGEGADVVFVHLMRFFVAAGAFAELFFEAGALVVGVVELAEAVGEFHAAAEDLEALHPVGLVLLVLGERRDGAREVVEDGRLDEMRFGDGLEHVGDAAAQRLLGIVRHAPLVLVEAQDHRFDLLVVAEVFKAVAGRRRPRASA